MASFDMSLVDEIRKRVDATYEEALMGLEEGEGDLLRALAVIERHRREKEAAEGSGELIGRAVGLAKEGKLEGLRLKLGDRVLRDLPAPKGVPGAVVGALVSALLSQLTLDLVRKEVEGEPTEEAG